MSEKSTTSTNLVSRYKRLVDPFFGFLVRPLARIGISPHLLTFLSFLAGVLAVWFLLSDDLLFVFYALLHILFDILDGALARQVGVTDFGEWLDHVLVDRLVALLLIIKAYAVLGEVRYLVVIGFFLLHQGIHWYTKRQAPIIYVRSTLIVLFMLGLFVEAPLIVGTLLVYGVLGQLTHTYEN